MNDTPTTAAPWIAAPNVADLTVTTDGRAVYFGAGTPALVLWLEAAFPAGTWTQDEDGRAWYLVTGARFQRTERTIDEQDSRFYRATGRGGER